MRPSPDRLRETLFNWLTPVVAGSRCLDLFAGSGALGIEAASRGAASVTLVEREPKVAAQLRENLARLAEPEDALEVVQADWTDALRLTKGPWDIVFVDPPFAEGLHESVLNALLAGLLAQDARVHVESGRHDAVPVPAAYEVLRDKQFGDVRARLLTLPK